MRAVASKHQKSEVMAEIEPHVLPLIAKIISEDGISSPPPSYLGTSLHYLFICVIYFSSTPLCLAYLSLPIHPPFLKYLVFMEDGLDLLTYVTFYTPSLSPSVWHLYPTLCNAGLTYGYDYIKSTPPCSFCNIFNRLLTRSDTFVYFCKMRALNPLRPRDPNGQLHQPRHGGISRQPRVCGGHRRRVRKGWTLRGLFPAIKYSPQTQRIYIKCVLKYLKTKKHASVSAMTSPTPPLVPPLPRRRRHRRRRGRQARAVPPPFLRRPHRRPPPPPSDPRR